MQLVELKKPLVEGDISTPEETSGFSLVKIMSAALNRRDFWIQQGRYPGIALPVVPGSDGAGLVGDRQVVINPGLQWGDSERFQGPEFNILGMPTQGTLAEYVLVPNENLFDKPLHLDWNAAAALPLAGVTAYRALFAQGEGVAGESVLITGVGGGVALTAMQFAIAASMHVAVTSGSQEKLANARRMGAIATANYHEEEWDSELKAQCGYFDLIIDSAGGSGFSKLLKLVKPGGRIIMYGGTLGKVPDMSPQVLYWRQATIRGSTMGSPLDFRAMLEFVDAHRIVPVVDAVYPLSDVNSALQAMESSTQFGKVVISITE